jgi:predicted phage terminase large subunit-like protein
MKDNFSIITSFLRRKAGKESLLAFARLYLSHYLKFPPSKAHIEIYDLLFDILKNRGKKIAIAAPRDFAKSTIVNLIFVLYCICYNMERFIVIISNTASQAEKLLENIKKELMENEMLKTDFPEIFEAGEKPKLSHSTQSDIISPNGIQLSALGSGQQIRGRRHGSYRPSLVIADDLEKGENTFSESSNERLKEYFSKSVLKSGSEDTNYIILGTIHHRRSLLAELISEDLNPGWIKKPYQAIISWPTNTPLWNKWAAIFRYKDSLDGFAGPEAALQFYLANKDAMDVGAQILWPERWNLYGLMKLNEENEYSFRSEMQNAPLDISSLVFKVDEFHYWDERYRSVEDLLRDLGRNAEFYGACDPSLGADPFRGDYSAIIVLVRDRRDDLLYIVTADIERRKPDKIIEDILAYHGRFKFNQFGFEVNQFQVLMLQDLVKRGQEKGNPIPTVPLKNIGPKINRIQSIQPSTKSGALQFSRGHGQLLDQCREFPTGKYDDGLDALEMAVRVAGTGSSGNYDDPEVFMAANDIPSVNKGRGRVTGIQSPGTGEIIYDDWMDWVCPRRKKR